MKILQIHFSLIIPIFRTSQQSKTIYFLNIYSYSPLPFTHDKKQPVSKIEYQSYYTHGAIPPSRIGGTMAKSIPRIAASFAATPSICLGLRERFAFLTAVT